jgi:Bacteriophage replication protein O
MNDSMKQFEQKASNSASRSKKDTKAVKNYVLEHSYVQIPNFVIDDFLPHLSGNEIKILMTTYRKTIGWSKLEDTISRRKLMDASGISSKQTLYRALDVLEVNGIIERQMCSGEMTTYKLGKKLLGHIATSNGLHGYRYENLDGDSDDNQSQQKTSFLKDTLKKKHISPNPLIWTNHTLLLEAKDNLQFETNTEIPIKYIRRWEQERLFEEFYEEYPKKTGKKRAFNIYIMLNALHSDVMHALAIYNNEIDACRTYLEFIKHPYTFLKGYEDYLEYERELLLEEDIAAIEEAKTKDSEFRYVVDGLKYIKDQVSNNTIGDEWLSKKPHERINSQGKRAFSDMQADLIEELGGLKYGAENCENVEFCMRALTIWNKSKELGA